MATRLSTYLYPGTVSQTLSQIAVTAGLPANFDWKEFSVPGLADHVNRFSVTWADSRYTNFASVVTAIVSRATSVYPQLNQILPQIGPDSEFWIQGEAFRQYSAELSKASGRADVIGMFSVFAAPLAAAFFAPAAAAGAGETITAGTVSSEAAMWEAVAVGWEGAVVDVSLQNAALAAAGGDLAASAALTEAIGADAANVMISEASGILETLPEVLQTAQLPQDLPQMPSQTPQVPKPVTDYAQKLLASEAMKFITGTPQSPGANAAQNTVQQGLAPGAEKADISPLLALAMIATALIS